MNARQPISDQLGLTIELPFPPSSNHYWGQRAVVARRGKAFVQWYIGEKGRKFREDVMLAVLLSKSNVRLQGPLLSHVILHAPDNRSRDMDNHAGKALYDALTHAKVYGDDAQVRMHIHEWGPNVPGGKCIITLSPLAGVQSAHNQLEFAACT